MLAAFSFNFVETQNKVIYNFVDFLTQWFLDRISKRQALQVLY